MLISQRCPKTKGSLPHKLVMAGGLKYKYESMNLDMHVHLRTSFTKLGGNWFTVNVCKKFAFNHVLSLRVPINALQIILDLCIPEKELAKTRSQISFIYFQSHSWNFVRNYVIPKGIMKTRLESRLPRKSSWKSINYYILDLNSGHLHRKHVFCHWTIKAR